MLSVIFSKLNLLMINSIIYFILGLLLFIYLLIEELRYYPTDDMTVIVPPKKRGYYDKGIYNVVLILNVCSGVIRITGSVFLFLFRLRLIKLQQRSKCFVAYNILLFEIKLD